MTPQEVIDQAESALAAANIAFFGERDLDRAESLRDEIANCERDLDYAKNRQPCGASC